MIEYERYEPGTRLVLTGKDWGDDGLLNCEVEVEDVRDDFDGDAVHTFVGIEEEWFVYTQDYEDFSATVVPDDAPKTRHIPVFGGRVIAIGDNITDPDERPAWATGGIIKGDDVPVNAFEGVSYTFKVVPGEGATEAFKRLTGEDPISPSHYQFPSGAQAIDMTRYLPFCEGNVIKYVARAGKKGKRLEDLRKAQQYLEWAIENAEKEADNVG